MCSFQHQNHQPRSARKHRHARFYRFREFDTLFKSDLVSNYLHACHPLLLKTQQMHFSFGMVIKEAPVPSGSVRTGSIAGECLKDGSECRIEEGRIGLSFWTTSTMESVTETKTQRREKKKTRTINQSGWRDRRSKIWNTCANENTFLIQMAISKSLRRKHFLNRPKTFIDFSRQNDVPPSDGVEWKRARRFEPEIQIKLDSWKFVFVELRGKFRQTSKAPL